MGEHLFVKLLLGLYNTYSPPVADFIAKHANLRALVRWSLLPLVGVSWVTLNLDPTATLVFMLLLSSGFIGPAGFRRKIWKR